ncbi:MAG: hypothetical protein ACXWUG_18515 [Polyangiales bacterium]
MRGSFFVFGSLGLLALATVVPTACSSSSNDAPVTEEDSGVLDSAPETSEMDSAVVDTGTASGGTLVLRIYDPEQRCYQGPTEIGRVDEYPDGAVAPCAMGESCYRRVDGVLAYHEQDCVHGANFRANWERLAYSDLGPCEPLKHTAFGFIKDCPMTTCDFARDLVVDTVKGCATQITTKGCRTSKPTACACDGKGNVFLAADATSTVPTGFTACDSTDAACKKALDAFDTLVGCAPSTGDAGSD